MRFPKRFGVVQPSECDDRYVAGSAEIFKHPKITKNSSVLAQHIPINLGIQNLTRNLN
jgi:hypothetical protein